LGEAFLLGLAICQLSIELGSFWTRYIGNKGGNDNADGDLFGAFWPAVRAPISRARNLEEMMFSASIEAGDDGDDGLNGQEMKSETEAMPREAS